MKILYITDLHGVKWKYDAIFQVAKSLKVRLVINGGDMLPTRPNFFVQGDFIADFLDKYFLKYNKNKIYFLSMLGNDDLKIFDDSFQKTCDKYSFVINMAQKKFKINGNEFIGMNWVSDLPFGLKDRCRKDRQDFKFPRQIGKAVLSTPNGIKRIKDWFSYADELPTIETEMNRLIRPIDMDKSIYIIHMPPSNLLLDVCSDGSKVGSLAIHDFLKKNQPLLSLHGHIHESPDISGKWRSTLNKTICIQPGQSNNYEDFLIYVIIDLKKMKFERIRLKKND